MQGHCSCGNIVDRSRGNTPRRPIRDRTGDDFHDHATDALPGDDLRGLDIESCSRKMKVDVADGRNRVPYYDLARCP